MNITNYLEKFEVVKGSEFTHTCLKNYKSYYLQIDDQDEFMEIYKKAYGKNMSITEKHRPQSPILIDLDFRQAEYEKLYTQQHILDILKILIEFLDDHVDVADGIDIFVLEKPPRACKDKIKDGLHIIIPSIVTKPIYQYKLREFAMPKINEILKDCGFLNNIEDIYDESVIERNNWFMYGSKKPDEHIAWEMSYIYEWKSRTITEKDPEHTSDELIDLFSIRNKFDINKVKIDLPELKKELDIEDSAVTERSEANSKYEMPSTMFYDTDAIIKLVEILNDTRADTYKTWMEVGWLLHNINTTQYINIWVDFSKRSTKFNKGECERLWTNMKNTGLGLGSLHMWAKEDDPEAYKDIIDKSLVKLIDNAKVGTHTYVARVVYEIYKDEYVCASIKSNLWYHYENHSWKKNELAYGLRLKISDQIHQMFLQRVQYYKIKTANAQETADRDKFKLMEKEMFKVSLKLTTSNFKDGVVKECAEKMFDQDFLKKIDSNPKLIGFTNGVYDLSVHEFRAGNTTDYITMSTGYGYPTQSDPETRIYLMNFIGSIMSNDAMKEYLIKISAYMLDGEKYLEELWFFTGILGRNGKGTYCNLLNKAFGGYYYEPDITLITSTKNSSSAANPELEKAKGKRVLVMSEPDDADKNSKLRVNKIKQFRGNDMLQARGLYQDFIEFKPQFGMIVQMNSKPELSKVDDAISKSLKIINFPFQFVHEPIIDTQKKIDTTLKGKFETESKYYQELMLILIEYHKKYVFGNQRIIEPTEVTAETTEYLNENNPVAVWMSKTYEIVADEGFRVKVEDLYQEYITNNPVTTLFNKKKFGELMSMIGFKSKTSNGTRYYVGIKKIVVPDIYESD